MRYRLLIFFILWTYVVAAQQLTAPDPAKLALELTEGKKNEYDKVRSIFEWITSNVEYQVRQVHSQKRLPAFNSEDDTGDLRSLDERVAIQVIQKKTAVCDGYSRLFKTLCKYAGIEAELVTGYARTSGYLLNERFKSNHTWNAVRINNEWKLLDVTWGSGFISRKGDYFIQHTNEEYFLAEPAKFIHEHYPDDIRWTLLPEPPIMQEYRYSPYKHRNFSKYNITRFSPSKGIIEARPGEVVKIVITTKDALKDAQVYADPFIDSGLYRTPVSALLIPNDYLGNKITYEYQVSSQSVQWLYLLYHNDIILRYRLVILKEEK